MTIKELRGLTRLSQVKFAERFHIPRRTVEEWEAGRRVPPEYVVELLEYRIKHEEETRE